MACVLIAFLTCDLVFPSRVAGVAQRLGARMETAATADALLTKLAAEPSQGVVVLLDLNLPGIDPATIVPRIKALATPPQAIIAFGPHVHEEKLSAAQAAGCDVVLTRGQFDVQMQNLLARILKPSGSP
jgi:CheY-like chemotaxis protein